MSHIVSSDPIKGGWRAHVLRRFLHVSMLAAPFLYYAYGTKLLLWIIMVAMCLFEAARLFWGFVFFAQRASEAKRISSLTWTVVSLCLVLWLSPDKRYAIPIIASFTLIDPLLGELRRLRLSPTWVACIGIIATMIIWWLATLWWQTPWLLALLMGPLTVWLEWPNFRWIDDNGLMQLVPLLVIMLLYG